MIQILTRKHELAQHYSYYYCFDKTNNLFMIYQDQSINFGNINNIINKVSTSDDYKWRSVFDYTSNDFVKDMSIIHEFEEIHHMTKLKETNPEYFI